MQIFRLSIFCLFFILFIYPVANLSAVTIPDTNPGIRELGLLTNVEDSGYPFYTLTIEFPERNFSEIFTINIGNMKNVDPQKLSSWVGKYVSFDYDSDIRNMIIDIRSNGKSIFNPDEVGPINSQTKKITGILSNAEQETQGDEPGVILITTVEEITESFEFYITSDIVRLNGKKVTCYYDQSTVNTINWIKLSK